MQHPGDTAVEPRRPKALASLQCARGVAALLVVYYHASSIANPQLTPRAVGEIWHNGRIASHLPIFGRCGVDLFFLISGYIIWTCSLSETSVSVFYKKRIARVVPLYWAVTISVAIGLYSIPGMFQTLRLDACHLIASLFFIPWPNPAFASGSPGEYTPLIVAGWTLNFEMMFYFLFGLSIAFTSSRLRGVLLIFAGFSALTVFAGQRVEAFRFYDPFLIAEFILGCVLAAFCEKRSCSGVTAIALLTIAFPGLLFLDTLELPLSRFLSMGIPACVSLFALIQLERGGWWPRLRPLVSIGDASYSIYLTHIVALAITRYAWRPFAHSLVFASRQEAFCAFVITIAVVVGLLCLNLVERPLLVLAEAALGIKRRRSSTKPPETLTSPGNSLALRIP